MAALQFSWVLLMLCVGLVGAITAYLGYWAGRRPDGAEEAPVEYPAGIRQGHGPVPAVLWALYVGMAAAMAGYVVWVWLTKPNY